MLTVGHTYKILEQGSLKTILDDYGNRRLLGGDIRKANKSELTRLEMYKFINTR